MGFSNQRKISLTDVSEHFNHQWELCYALFSVIGKKITAFMLTDTDSPYSETVDIDDCSMKLDGIISEK